MKAEEIYKAHITMRLQVHIWKAISFQKGSGILN